MISKIIVNAEIKPQPEVTVHEFTECLNCDSNMEINVRSFKIV